jgi:hypothetical protein
MKDGPAPKNTTAAAAVNATLAERGLTWRLV